MIPINSDVLRPKRSENFSLPEIIFILDRIKLKGDVLFHSATNPQRRAQGWEEIIQELHQAHPNWPLRNEHQLRNWWRKAKTYARKYHFWKVTGNGFQVGFKRAETVPKLVLEIIQEYESPENTFPSETTINSNSFETMAYPDCNLSDNVSYNNESVLDNVKTELQDDCIIVSSGQEQPPTIDVKSPSIEAFNNLPSPQQQTVASTAPQINSMQQQSIFTNALSNGQLKKRQILPRPFNNSRAKYQRRSAIGLPMFPTTNYSDRETFFNNHQPDIFESNSYADSQLPINNLNYFQTHPIFPITTSSSTPKFIRTSPPQKESLLRQFPEKQFESSRLEMETLRHEKEMELLDFKLKAAYEEHTEKMKYIREKQRQLLIKRDAH